MKNMTLSTTVKTTILLLAVGALLSCGRAPSRLLRQGQLPIYDFPLYFVEGVPGRVWKVDRDRTRTLVAEGLQDPRGLATDRFQNAYVAEYGAGRILKIGPDAAPGEYEVVREGMAQPSAIAVDSFGEVYATQDGERNVMRLSDGKVFATYATVPTALTFGVNDQVVVGLFNDNKVLWGYEGDAAVDLPAPLNASIDGTGRVYVAQGDPNDGKVYRYHQRDPGEGVLVADNLVGPSGIAVDLVGNIFVAEQGAGRIVLVSFDGNTFSWLSDVQDPQALAFTQY